MNGDSAAHRLHVCLLFLAAVVAVNAQSLCPEEAVKLEDHLASGPTFERTICGYAISDFRTRRVIAVGGMTGASGGGGMVDDEVSAQPHGGIEFRVWANAMSFFSKTLAGVSFETSCRWPGKNGKPDGHFSIGLQASFWPSVGRWNEVPFDIGSISAFRLTNAVGEDGIIRFGSVVVQPNELFLVGREGAPIRLTGRFYMNPLSSNIFEYTTTRISNMRTKMAGVYIPLRWYWGEQRSARPRFFTEAGVGMDLLFAQADYEVTTRGIQYEESTNSIVFNSVTRMDEEPLGGDVSKSLLFSHGNVGGGTSYGRFTFFAQARFLFTSTLTSKQRDVKRVRGNVLAIPLLAGADADPAIAEKLERDGVVVFGATGLSKKEQESLTDNEGLANGASEFWDSSQWIFGVAFLLR